MYKQKALFLATGPTPYRCAFFAELGKMVDLTVLYEINHSYEREWEINDQRGYQEITLKNWKRSVNNAFCPEVIKYLKKPFDHIVVGGYSTPTGMLAILWLKAHKKKFILNADGGIISGGNPVKERIKRFFISSAAGWLSPGVQTTEYFLHYGARKENIYEYPFTSVMQQDCLKEPLSREEKTQYRNKLNIKEDKMVITVGQFIPRKGFDVLLKACKGIDPAVGVYIVGGKPTEEYIQLRETLGLNNVHFVGFMQKKDLMEYYLAADVFVLPTREDIWGLVVNEALAKALPVVTTNRCVAGLELVKNEHNGYIVPVEDEQALAEAVNRVLAGNLSRMSQAALDSVRNYTIEEMAKRHYEIFEEIEKQ